MRAISEILTLVIITAALVAIASAIFIFTFTQIEQTRRGLEYGFARTQLISIATRLPDIIRGSTIEARYSSQVVSFGFREPKCELYLDITFANGTKVSIPIKNYVVAVGTMHPIVTNPRRGLLENYTIVRDMGSVISIDEFFENGYTYTEIFPAGVVHKSYNITIYEGGAERNITVHEIDIVTLNPSVRTGALFRAYYGGGDCFDAVAIALRSPCGLNLRLEETSIRACVHRVNVDF